MVRILMVKRCIIVNILMNKLAIYISFFLFSIFLSGYSQRGPEVVLPDTTKPLFKKVMIIPFEESMYLCGVQTYLAQRSKKTHNEIVQYFREETALELQNQFLYRYNTVSLLHFNDTAKDLYRAYDAISYKFEVAPVEVEEEEQPRNALDKAKNLSKNLFKKKETTPSPYVRGTTNEGQIVSRKSTTQKFANIKVNKPETLKYLGEKYNADLFVYVTEFDIENDMSNQVAFVDGTYKRLLKLHFSMVDLDGKIVEKGLIMVPFPNNENDITIIRTLYLPQAAKKMMDKLPYTPSPMVDEKKGKGVNASDKVRR